MYNRTKMAKYRSSIRAIRITKTTYFPTSLHLYPTHYVDPCPKDERVARCQREGPLEGLEVPATYHRRYRNVSVLTALHACEHIICMFEGDINIMIMGDARGITCYDKIKQDTTIIE